MQKNGSEQRQADAVPAAEGSVAVKKGEKRSVPGIVFTCIGGAIVLFLFFVAVVLAVDKFVKKSPVPSFFGTSTLIVTTGSMSGTIEDGDVIIVKRADEYKVGDIVTFIQPGDTVPTTHRIIRITDDRYYTKGDANNAEDMRPLYKSEIVGKVTGTIPHLGLFFRWLKDDFGWIYLVAIVGVIVGGIILLKQFPVKKAAPAASAPAASDTAEASATETNESPQNSASDTLDEKHAEKEEDR